MVTNQSDTFEIGGEMTIHRLGVGAMRITGPNIIGPPANESIAHEVLRTAIDLGVDFIDTADSYGPGVSERLIRTALDPDDAVVATKAGLLRNTDGEWLRHGDPDYLWNQALVSRDRLGVETIDLFQFHAPDPDVPYEDSIQACAELKDEGIIAHVGLSNVGVDHLETARDHVEIATVQNQYNVAYRRDEAVLQACEEYNIGFIPWSPLGVGSLDSLGEAIETIADDHGASQYQIALAWLLEHSPVMLPIPGTSDPDHLRENVEASTIELSPEEYSQLLAASE